MKSIRLKPYRVKARRSIGLCAARPTASRAISFPRHRALVTRIGASSDDQEPQKWNWNPFKKDDSKQEAAERAVRDAMGDRKDVLADFEGGDGDDDDGGDDDIWGFNFNWSWDEGKDKAKEFGLILLGWLKIIGKGILTFFIFSSTVLFIGFSLPFMGLFLKSIRVLLRLDKPEDIQWKRKNKAELAGKERSVLFSGSEDEEEAEVGVEEEKELVGSSSGGSKREGKRK